MITKTSAPTELLALRALVDAFALLMKQRLEEKLTAGMSGWDDADKLAPYCSNLASRLDGDIDDRNLVDIACLAAIVQNIDPKPITQINYEYLKKGDRFRLTSDSGSIYTATITSPGLKPIADLVRIRHTNQEELTYSDVPLPHRCVAAGKSFCYGEDHRSSTPIVKIEMLEPAIEHSVCPTCDPPAPADAISPEAAAEVVGEEPPVQY